MSLMSAPEIVVADVSVSAQNGAYLLACYDQVNGTESYNAFASRRAALHAAREFLAEFGATNPRLEHKSSGFWYGEHREGAS